MKPFYRYLALLTLILAVTACQHKKKPSLSGEEPVDIQDFMSSFAPLPLPYQVGDTLFTRKENDSLLISYKVLTQFVPDSVISKVYGKNVKPKIYPLGMAADGEKKYILLKTITPGKKGIYVLGFDRKNKFLSAIQGLFPDQQSNTSQSLAIDKHMGITKTVTRKNADGSISEGKDVYDLDVKSGKFSLAMTDPLDEKKELINPIDTLPRKNKYAADYTNGKMNLVSVRDTKRGDRIMFFIHFEKNNGQCTGELKGEALFRTANTAEYRQGGDPCVLKLIFTSNAVTLQEEEGCGNRRGLDCSFNGSFARKKNPKPATPVRATRK